MMSEFLLAFISTCNYGSILNCLRVIGRKSRNLYTPPVFSVFAGGGDPVGISRTCLIFIKIEWSGYHVIKKLWRTDGRTDGQTDKIAISIQYRASVC